MKPPFSVLGACILLTCSPQQYYIRQDNDALEHVMLATPPFPLHCLQTIGAADSPPAY